MKQRLIAIDTETTGVSKDSKICEIAWSELDENLKVIRSGYSLINPGVPIPYAAAAVNGITDAMVADAPCMDEYMAGEGAHLIGADVLLIAHNCSFDYGYLKPYLHDETTTLCTLKCARHVWPDAENHKQATLAYMLGIAVDRAKAHSADGDIEVLIGVLRALLEETGAGIEGLLHIQAIPRVITRQPWGKHKGKLLADVPRDYVVWMLTKCDNLSDDLRAALVAL